MVKKSISVTTLPRYAVNPTLEGDVNDFKSLRGTPKALEDAANNAPVAEHPKSKSLSGTKSVNCHLFCSLIRFFFFLVRLSPRLSAHQKGQGVGGHVHFGSIWPQKVAGPFRRKGRLDK